VAQVQYVAMCKTLWSDGHQARQKHQQQPHLLRFPSKCVDAVEKIGKIHTNMMLHTCGMPYLACGRPSEYLFVMQEPKACMTARDVKFSEAISSKPRTCSGNEHEGHQTTGDGAHAASEGQQ
jgi:hypothetical protein